MDSFRDELKSDPTLILGQIFLQYEKQVEKCEKAGAYLAGSIMLGALLEAFLLQMALVYPDEVKAAQIYHGKKVKSLEKWSLFDLLKLAIELKWIPTHMQIDRIFRASGIEMNLKQSKGDLAYMADVVREIRDMVHPGRYLRRWEGRRIAERHYRFCFRVTNLVRDSISDKIIASVYGPEFVGRLGARKHRRSV